MPATLPGPHSPQTVVAPVIKQHWVAITSKCGNVYRQMVARINSFTDNGCDDHQMA
jgi:hypothetical protein